MGLFKSLGKIAGVAAPFVAMWNPAIGAAMGMFANMQAQKEAKKNGVINPGALAANSRAADIVGRVRNKRDLVGQTEDLIAAQDAEDAAGGVTVSKDISPIALKKSEPDANPDSGTDKAKNSDPTKSTDDPRKDTGTAPVLKGTDSVDWYKELLDGGGPQSRSESGAAGIPRGQPNNAIYGPSTDPKNAMNVNPMGNIYGSLDDNKMEQNFAEGGAVQPASAIPMGRPAAAAPALSVVPTDPQDKKLADMQAEWEPLGDAIDEHRDTFDRMAHKFLGADVLGEELAVITDIPEDDVRVPTPAPAAAVPPQPANPMAALPSYASGGMVRALADGGAVHPAPAPVEPPAKVARRKPSDMQTYYSANMDEMTKTNDAFREARVSTMRYMAKHTKSTPQQIHQAGRGIELEMRRKMHLSEAYKAKRALMMGNDDAAAKHLAVAFGSEMDGGNSRITVVGPGKLAITKTDPDGGAMSVGINPEGGAPLTMKVFTMETAQDFIDMAGNPGLYGAGNSQAWEENISKRRDRKSDNDRADKDQTNKDTAAVESTEKHADSMPGGEGRALEERDVESRETQAAAAAVRARNGTTDAPLTRKQTEKFESELSKFITEVPYTMPPESNEGQELAQARGYMKSLGKDFNAELVKHAQQTGQTDPGGALVGLIKVLRPYMNGTTATAEPAAAAG